MYKPTTLRAYLLRAEEAGYRPDDLLAGSGYSWRQIEELETMPLEKLADLFGNLATRTSPDFAIQCAISCKISDFGIVGFAMQSMPTLRHAFEYWNRYCLLAGHPLVTSIHEGPDIWEFHFVPRRLMSAQALRFCLEVSIAALIPVIEELTGSPADTRQIDFAFPAPASLGRYDALGIDKLRFGQGVSVFYGNASDLDRPIRSHDDELSSIFHEKCDRFLAELTRSRTIVEQLEDLMIVSAGHMPTLAEMAQTLRISQRTLQRSLKEQGTSYQELVRGFRSRHAKLLLCEQRANAKSVAYMLGFADVSSFRRAFREWTGQSIGQWIREQNRRQVRRGEGRVDSPGLGEGAYL